MSVGDPLWIREVPRQPAEAEIRLRAYRIWQWLGAPDGYEVEIWSRAEEELKAEFARAAFEEMAPSDTISPSS